MRSPNPYRPGFNQVPVLLAGRQDVLSAIDEALDVAALDDRTPRPIIVTGTRGVGKTVVLDEARRAAGERHSWLSAAVEVQPGRPFLPLLRSAVVAARDSYEQRPPGREGWRVTKTTLKAGTGIVSAEAELTRSETPVSGTLREDLEQLMAVAAKLGAGLMVTVDEAHLAAKEELGELAAALQHAVGQDWPLLAVIAGLPSIQSPKRMVTYLERGEWHTLGLLHADETREALAEPARLAGRPMDPEAVAILSAAAGGYPYAIQVLGHHSWRRSHGQPTITASHAADACADAERDLANGLYSSRWNDSSNKEQEYLVALAQLLMEGEEPTGADVARQLMQPVQAVSYLRERLLRKGTIYSGGRALRLAVPGMAAWVVGQADGETTSQRTEPKPVFTARWRHTTEGLEVPSASTSIQKQVDHPGYRSDGYPSQPTRLVVSVLMACEPLHDFPSSTAIATSLLNLLNDATVRGLVSALAEVDRDLSWSNYWSNGRLNNHAVLSSSSDDQDPPLATVILNLNDGSPRVQRFQDPRRAELILSIDPEARGAAFSPLGLQRWHAWLVQVLALPSAFADFLAQDVRVATRNDPATLVAVSFQGHHGLLDLVDVADAQLSPGAPPSSSFPTYLVADSEGKPSALAAVDVLRAVCDYGLHALNYEKHLARLGPSAGRAQGAKG